MFLLKYKRAKEVQLIFLFILEHKRRKGLQPAQTRSSKDECSTRSNNDLRSTDLFRSKIIEFNRSKNLDDVAPSHTPPQPPFYILVGHWRMLGCFLSPNHHHLSYHLSVFLFFVFLSQYQCCILVKSP